VTEDTSDPELKDASSGYAR